MRDKYRDSCFREWWDQYGSIIGLFAACLVIAAILKACDAISAIEISHPSKEKSSE